MDDQRLAPPAKGRSMPPGTDSMLTLLHISDLHFGPPFVPRVGQALLEIAPQLEPDAIEVSGDLSQPLVRMKLMS